MRRLLREPLLHFFVIGAALFLAYALIPRRERDGDARTIVITQGQVEHLAATFGKTWQRPPSAEELAGLVRDHVREEVYCREAIALGLDRDDSVIRRRLMQKMEFLAENAAPAEPTDAELAAYLAAHPGSFRVEPRLTFRQVYLSADKHGEDLARDASRLLAELEAAGNDADVSQLGDVSLLEQDFAAIPVGEVAKLFGDDFAAKVAGLAPGQWRGPVESGYGLHLVLVRERVEGRLPALAEVREVVLRDWHNARRLAGNEAFYDDLRKRYTVTVEGAGDPQVAAK